MKNKIHSLGATDSSADLVLKKILQSRTKSKSTYISPFLTRRSSPVGDKKSSTITSNRKVPASIDSTSCLNFQHSSSNLHIPNFNSNCNSNNITINSNCKRINGQNESIFTKNLVENECSGVCRNLQLLKKCEMRIKELLEVNEKLKKINEYLIIAMNKKENMYTQVTNENFTMKTSLISMKKQIRAKSGRIKHGKSVEVNNKLFLDSTKHKEFGTVTLFVNNKNTTNENENNQITVTNSEEQKAKRPSFANNSPNNNRVSFTPVKLKMNQLNLQGIENKKPTNQNEWNLQLSKETSKYLTPKGGMDSGKGLNSNYGSNLTTPRGNNNTPLHRPYQKIGRLNNASSSPYKSPIVREMISNKSSSHYEKINEMGARNQKRKYKGELRMSFLSMDDALLHKMISNHITREIFNLTMYDDDFIDAMRFSPEDRLVTYGDAIGNIIKDYQNSLRLITRIKLFLKSSINLVNSVLLEDSTACLIKNACEILDCERTTLFVHDKVSNMLVVHSASEGLKKAELKVPKDKGIVGICFMNGERVKVDDAYSDIRFNKEVDKATGFKTRNILCLPLKDNDGLIFGAIQSINKRGGHFNNDDEELMEIFSCQASAILKNSQNFDENSKYISRLKMILSYNFNLEDIIDAQQFTILTEELLMSLFSTNAAQLLIYNKNKNILVHVNKYHIEEKKKLGIINYVFQKKEFYGANSCDDCEYFNKLTDIETGFSLITFPILSLKPGEENVLLGVVQLAYNGKLLSGITKKPKELEMSIIEFLHKIISIWMGKNTDKLIF